MVEYSLQLNNIFSSMADPTRRDILRRVSGRELSVGEIAQPYKASLAAISKHIKILENAQLIIKRRHGKYYYVQASRQTIKSAEEYLRQYEILWNERFDTLDNLLKEG